MIPRLLRVVASAASALLATTPPPPLKLDARGIPSHACPACGHTFFQLVAHFEDYELSFYTLDGTCDDCGALVTVPTPIDAPGYVA